MTEKTILKVLVGSHAHGLATEESDRDYRGVFIVPTSDLLKIGGKPAKHTSWVEGKEDDTSWELGKFLSMAVKGNPSILEVFRSPTVELGERGHELKNLFPHVWGTQEVYDSFLGYGMSQRKKFLEMSFDNKRAGKFAVAYLRSLYMGTDLLLTGTFEVDVRPSPIYERLACWKRGEFSHGEVIDVCLRQAAKLEQAYLSALAKLPNLAKVNEFLLDVRLNNWAFEE